MLPKRRVLSADISIGSERQFVDEIFRLAEERTGRYVTYTNVHMLMEADKDPAFARVVNNAAIACPDGAPVAMYIKRFHGIGQPRLPGMDMLPVLLREAQKRGKSVYFYGSREEVLNAIAKKIGEELPGLKLAGTYSPPFRVLTDVEKADIVKMINAADPDLLFVALGCPRQERWMAEHQGSIKACMLGVGQAFLTFAGMEKRLPPALRKLPVEWIYRLMLEPKRLFKRYLFTNSRFLYLVGRRAIRGKE